MNVDELLRDALREQAEEQAPVGPGLADRVLSLRRRRRTRRYATVAAVTAAVVAVAVAVPLLASGKGAARPTGVVRPDEIKAHPDQSPPRDRIAVGDTVLAGYSVWRYVEQTAYRGSVVDTYWLLDQKTGKYVKAPKWSYVAFAPGMKTAAVLEQGLPANRIGLLDLASGKVERWIQVDHGVGSLDFSPDGRRLVATTYAGDPNLQVLDKDTRVWERSKSSFRTGFYVLDVAAGKGRWSAVTPPNPRNSFSAAEAFTFSHDGRYVRVWSDREDEEYFDFSGTRVPEPKNERYRQWTAPAGISPSGDLVAADFPGKKWKYSSWVIDARNGDRTEVHGQQLLAWVGDRQLIAWGVAGAAADRERLVLLTVGSDKVVPLSGPRPVDGLKGTWQPLFAQR